MTPLPLQITCREFVELVTAHEDCALPERDRIRFEAHSQRCPGCHAYLQQLRLMMGLHDDSRGIARSKTDSPFINALTQNISRRFERCRRDIRIGRDVPNHRSGVAL